MPAPSGNVAHDIDHEVWDGTGALLIDGFLEPDRLSEVQGWVEELEQTPPAVGGPLQYDERLADGSTARCRTENFVPVHDGLRELLTTGPILDIASRLLGEGAVLYKEKINYKLPGGAGFNAHQDAPAYPFVRSTITCMVALDDSTQDNGCLEIVEGMHRDLLPTDSTGCLPKDLADTLSWTPVPARAGSLLWFNWYVPHRSGPNRSDRRRRAIYLTYNGASDGNLRGVYYEEKAKSLAGAGGRISLIGHFNGDAKEIKGS